MIPDTTDFKVGGVQAHFQSPVVRLKLKHRAAEAGGVSSYYRRSANYYRRSANYYRRSANYYRRSANVGVCRRDLLSVVSLPKGRWVLVCDAPVRNIFSVPCLVQRSSFVRRDRSRQQLSQWSDRCPG